MASGRICTGFSLPYVALYAESGGSVTYSSGQKLARGVEVSIEPEGGDDNVFYADNVASESVGGTFTGGTVTLTVDGLLESAEQLILGLPDPTQETIGQASVDVYHYGDGIEIPYVGIGFIARYLSGGDTSYVPVVLTKTRFDLPSMTAHTEEGSIDFQTQELSAVLFRDGTSTHDWKLVAEEQDTEAKAEAVLKYLLDIS